MNTASRFSNFFERFMQLLLQNFGLLLRLLVLFAPFLMGTGVFSVFLTSFANIKKMDINSNRQTLARKLEFLPLDEMTINLISDAENNAGGGRPSCYFLS